MPYIRDSRGDFWVEEGRKVRTTRPVKGVLGKTLGVVQVVHRKGSVKEGHYDYSYDVSFGERLVKGLVAADLERN